MFEIRFAVNLNPDNSHLYDYVIGVDLTNSRFITKTDDVLKTLRSIQSHFVGNSLLVEDGNKSLLYVQTANRPDRDRILSIAVDIFIETWSSILTKKE